MSEVSALQFLAQAIEDPALQKRVQQVETPEQLLAIAQEQGYDVSHEDMVAATGLFKAGELSDEDLELVVGGGVAQDAFNAILEASRIGAPRRTFRAILKVFNRSLNFLESIAELGI